MDANTKGTCYLLHFSRSYRHARHYLGWALDLNARLDEHLEGNGARLLDVVTAEGIDFKCVRTWPGMTLQDEKRLKNRHSPALCPLCNPQQKSEARVDAGE